MCNFWKSTEQFTRRCYFFLQIFHGIWDVFFIWERIHSSVWIIPFTKFNMCARTHQHQIQGKKIHGQKYGTLYATIYILPRYSLHSSIFQPYKNCLWTDHISSLFSSVLFVLFYFVLFCFLTDLMNASHSFSIVDRMTLLTFCCF